MGLVYLEKGEISTLQMLFEGYPRVQYSPPTLLLRGGITKTPSPLGNSRVDKLTEARGFMVFGCLAVEVETLLRSGLKPRAPELN